MRVFSIVRQNRRTYWIGAAIGAAGALGSALLGARAAKSTAGAGVLSLNEQKQLFDYQQNRLEALQNSAHQREVEDLKKAGLNPILSAGGQGAASGLGATIDANAYNQAQSSSNQQKLNARLAVSQGLMEAGSRLMQYSIDKQNANSATVKANADLHNAQTNANNSASQISLNAQNAQYLSAQAKKTLDDLLTNNFIRNNLHSQSVLNLTSAQNIKALQDSIIQKNIADANSSLFRIGQSVISKGASEFEKLNEKIKQDQKKNKSSAKQEKTGHWSSDSLYYGGGY